MSDPIVSRIQSIQARIKEIENFGKPAQPQAPKETRQTNAESFSQIMKEVGSVQNLETLLGADGDPQSPLQNRADSIGSIASEALRTAMDETAQKKSRVNFQDIVARAAQKHGVDPKLVHAIISAESAYNPIAVSSKGARGLMQLMPSTAKELGVTDSFDPEQNIFGGTRYIKELLDRYGGDLVRALAAYNAGPSAVDKADGIPRFAETQIYVPKVLKNYYNLNREE